MPLKRIPKLIPLSHEHHDSLLLCWKIREGIKNETKPEQIHAYLKWYWDAVLKKHFEKEEIQIFPILGVNHSLIQQLLNQHIEIEISIKKESINKDEIQKIERLIFHHIRTEERELFELIQNEYIEEIPQIEKENFMDNYEDTFWLNK